MRYSEWELFKGICQKQGKGMNGIPTVICDVHDVRNSGTPTGRESYGVGVLVVVGGVTPTQGERESRSQGKAGQVDAMRRKNTAEECVMLPMMS